MVCPFTDEAYYLGVCGHNLIKKTLPLLIVELTPLKLSGCVKEIGYAEPVFKQAFVITWLGGIANYQLCRRELGLA
jgi:hypothetical protein